MVKYILPLFLIACTPLTVNSQVVYNELVEAGCVAPGDASLTAVQEGIQSDAAPSWFSCLLGGDSVATCKVPCGNH